MAHHHLGILAYWVVTTIRHQLKQNGINADWREITQKMNTQKFVTTSLVNNRQQTIAVRQCTEPTSDVKAIYDILKYKYAPFTRKNPLYPLWNFKKMITLSINALQTNTCNVGYVDVQRIVFIDSK